MPARTVMEAYFDAFNKHDPDAVAALFVELLVHIEATRAVQLLDRQPN